jgi:hypothetical protein
MPQRLPLDDEVVRWTLPAGSFYRFLAEYLPHIASEEVVGGLFSETLGRPSTPPEHLVAILLLRYHDDVSYAWAAERAQFDVRWKAVLGYAPNDKGPPMSDTTLQSFEDLLRARGRHDAVFTRSVELAYELGWLTGPLVGVQDSSPVQGKGAVKDTYNLLGDGIRRLVRALAKSTNEKPLAVAERYGAADLFRRSTKATANIDWSSPDARRGFLQRLVETGQALIVAIDPREPWGTVPVVRKAIAIIEKIIAQDVERDEQGRLRLRQGVAEDRLISVGDPEMRRGHKSQSEPFEGYKFHHTTEPVHGFVLAHEVTGANVHDSVPSEPMAERAEETSGCIVEKIIGDGAYGAMKNRVAHAEAGRELVAKLPRTPEGKVFPKQAFAIDLAARTVTCPQGVTTGQFEIVRHRGAEAGRAILRPDERARLFVFNSPACDECPQRSACIPASKPARTIEVGPHEDLLLAARAYEATPAFPVDRRTRQVAERMVARLVQLGARVARVVGQVKVGAQIAIIAAVANLTRLTKLMASRTVAT